MGISDKDKRHNLSSNLKWMSSYFKSYNLLSALLKTPSKFVSRAINSPQDLSIRSMEKLADVIGITENELFGNSEEFKKATRKWIAEKHTILNMKKDKPSKRRRFGKV